VTAKQLSSYGGSLETACTDMVQYLTTRLQRAGAVRQSRPAPRNLGGAAGGEKAFL
jgi:hypothetical protein